MRRRRFVRIAISTPFAAVTAKLLSACSVDESTASALKSDTADEPAYKSFGYYQGLLPNETRSSSRTDGTYSSMPCVTLRDIERGVQKDYLFWHGHGSGNHKFTVMPEDFQKLREGKAIEILTNVIDGHRHALRISPEESCESDCSDE